MKLCSYYREDTLYCGLIAGDRVIECGHDIRQLLISPADRAQGQSYRLDEITLAPVIPKPDKIFCIGVNYHDHRRETGRPEIPSPTVFTRFANTLIAAGQPICLPPESSKVDFEGELAVVIGKPGRRIHEADAWDHVAGLTCFNDISVRDWQGHASQFTPGKNFVGTGPLGPWLTTLDEVADPSGLQLTTTVSGQVMQNASTRDLIFPIPRLIAYISTFTELAAGDVISTGTPGGVGYKRTPPRYLQPGDTVVVEIEGVGRLENPVESEA